MWELEKRPKTGCEAKALIRRAIDEFGVKPTNISNQVTDRRDHKLISDFIHGHRDIGSSKYLHAMELIDADIQDRHPDKCTGWTRLKDAAHA